MPPDGLEEYARAVSAGFHSEFHADDFEVTKPTIVPDRVFGFRAGGRWVATTMSWPKTMTVPGGTVGAAAVSEVTVAPGYRRRGLLTKMMRHQLTDIAARGTEPVTVLWATESLIYGRFGYGQVTRRLELSGLTRELAFLPEVDLGHGSADEVTREQFLALAVPLRESLVADRPGHLDRNQDWWNMYLNDPERDRNGAGPIRYLVHFTEEGEADGFATFRTKRQSSQTDQGGEVVIGDLDAANPAAYAALWRWLLDLDLIRAFSKHVAPTDEPLRQLVANPRMITAKLSDATYARIVDVPAALSARTYRSELDLTLEVIDNFLPDFGGRFRLAGGPDGATVTRTDQTPDLTLTARQLSAVYLGGTSVQEFARAGLLSEHSPGAVHAATVAFGSDRAPFCHDFF
jgi:predicted acetyltransferase